MSNINNFEISDFHTHSFASDGILSRVELIRRAAIAGYSNICIADHCAEGDLENVIKACIVDCQLSSNTWDINAIPGIELTHVPPEQIDRLAEKAKNLGASIVVVHGESIVEPVAPGTNKHALRSKFVDILSHPGNINEEELETAIDNNIFIEITTRQGHCLSNGLVAARCGQVGAKMVINSDAHAPSDLLSKELILKALKGCGLTQQEIEKIVFDNVKDLLNKVKPR